MNKPASIAVTVKISKIGNSAGIILPKEVLARLRVAIGDTLHVSETSGGLHVSPYDPELVHQMELAESIMRRDRDILRALAK